MPFWFNTVLYWAYTIGRLLLVGAACSGKCSEPQWVHLRVAGTGGEMQIGVPSDRTSTNCTTPRCASHHLLALGTVIGVTVAKNI